MNQFTTKYAENLQGVVSGFDRLVFHGTLRTLSSIGGMKGYLSYANILWKDFADHAHDADRDHVRRLLSTVLLLFVGIGMAIIAVGLLVALLLWRRWRRR